MATRNPMNQRYQGEGPGGQTRKSASSAKPTSQAAGSVYIKKKPVTEAEKRAAKKAREKEAAAKAKLKAEKAKAAKAKAERAAAVAAGEMTAEEAAEAAAAAKAASIAAAAGGGSLWEKFKKGFLNLFKSQVPGTSPRALEYKKWRRLYWSLLGLGVVSVAISFLMTSNEQNTTVAFIISMVIAYGAIIGAIVIDVKKARPLLTKSKAEASGKKTPKSEKHAQEAAAQATAAEAARKAAKASKRGRRKEKTVVSGEPDDAVVDAPGEAVDAVVEAPVDAAGTTVEADDD
ncbi:MAG: hypothetical protein FWF91_03170 [Coriobacteriia bacterium]|nr:hypothetical protein [Coriobacteriia bacterium]